MAKLKRNIIQLVVDPKAEELKLETFLTPQFIPYELTYELVSTMETFDKAEKGEIPLGFVERYDMLADAIVKIYDKQFTVKDLKTRFHAPGALNEFIEQIQFIINGQQSDETKNFIASMK